VSHSDRPVEGRVLVREDASNGVAQLEHARVRELLSDEVDGTLSSPDRMQVREHLDSCEACRAFRNTLNKVVDVAGTFPRPRLAEETKQRIVNQLLEESSTRT
jgi:predicted anti-sigma-YlaC factor YlaD